jgi:hypothetical protein
MNALHHLAPRFCIFARLKPETARENGAFRRRGSQIFIGAQGKK